MAGQVIAGLIILAFTIIFTIIFIEKRREERQIKRDEEKEARQIKREEEIKRCKELEGDLRKHSADLGNNVIERWFEPLTITVEHNLHIIAQTSLARAIYDSHNRSRIINSIRFYYLDNAKITQIIKHLKDGYPHAWKIWEDCKRLSKDYLTGHIKLCEDIEKKVITKISAEFTECNVEANPLTCYILDETVAAIYQEAQQFMRYGKFLYLFKKIPTTININGTAYSVFQVGDVSYARSPKESLVDEFIKLVYDIAKDETLLEQLKLLIAKKENDGIENNVNKFKLELNKIKDHFKEGDYILKDTCERCKAWVDKLTSLNEAYYKKLISPD